MNTEALIPQKYESEYGIPNDEVNKNIDKTRKGWRTQVAKGGMNDF